MAKKNLTTVILESALFGTNAEAGRHERYSALRAEVNARAEIAARQALYGDGDKPRMPASNDCWERNRNFYTSFVFDKDQYLAVKAYQSEVGLRSTKEAVRVLLRYALDARGSNAERFDKRVYEASLQEQKTRRHA